MIKLALMAIISVLVAFFNIDGETKPSSPMWNFARTPVEEQDRHFLELLIQQDSTLAMTERADQAFLASTEVEAREELIPVRRAIAIERTAMPASVDPVAEAFAEGFEVRRAIPVARSTTLASSADRRDAMQQPFVTLIEEQAPVRRATAVDGRRSSITIFGDQVIVRSKVSLR